MMPALQEHPLALTPLGSVIAVEASATIQDVVQLFNKHSILSCPVYRGSQDDNDFIGIVNVFHVVGKMMDSFAHDGSIPEVDEDALDESQESFTACFDALPSEYSSQPVGDLPLDPFEPVEEGCSLATMIQRMANHKLKRVPIVNADNKLVNFVSQSLVIRQLAADPSLLGSLGDQTLEAVCGGQPQALQQMSAERKVTEAFELLRENHISAVPVVDPITEQFVGEINVRQAYYISIASNKMRLLSMSCRDFIAFVNRKQKWDMAADVLQVDQSATMAHVLPRLAAAHQRRVYVCNEARLPERVVSLQDLLAAIAAHA
eukprot:m.22402 g.22402  ORF g.22402 m.22402 type:complete len:318 (+) comp11246_c0_seq2:54-1007(+)